MTKMLDLLHKEIHIFRQHKYTSSSPYFSKERCLLLSLFFVFEGVCLLILEKSLSHSLHLAVLTSRFGELGPDSTVNSALNSSDAGPHSSTSSLSDTRGLLDLASGTVVLFIPLSFPKVSSAIAVDAREIFRHIPEEFDCDFTIARVSPSSIPFLFPTVRSIIFPSDWQESVSLDNSTELVSVVADVAFLPMDPCFETLLLSPFFKSFCCRLLRTEVRRSFMETDLAVTSLTTKTFTCNDLKHLDKGQNHNIFTNDTITESGNQI